MGKGTRAKATNIARAAVQVVSFVLLPGLFAEALSGIGVLVAAVVHGSFSILLVSQMLAAIVTIVVTVLVGRVFCGWVCSFGAMEDLAGAIGHGFSARVQVPREVDRWLKLVKYVVLAVIVLCWLGIISLSASWSPWEAFALLATWPPDFAGALSGYGVGLALLAAIMFGSLFVERLFCRYLCPMGAIYAIVSHVRLVRIRKPRKACGAHCRACTSVCSMGISLGEADKVSSGECIDCMRCTAICPRKNATLGPVPPDAAPVVTAACAVSILGLYSVGSVVTNGLVQDASQPVATMAQTQSVEVVEPQATTDATTADGGTSDAATTTADTIGVTTSGYADGTFTGSGTGHKGGTTTVGVTISNGVITDIATVSTQDDTSYYGRAYSTVVSEIIEEQGADVSPVSGATHSSVGIMEAVANALAQATA